MSLTLHMFALVLMGGVHAQKKEIGKLEREKEALSQKHSTDPEIVKYVATL